MKHGELWVSAIIYTLIAVTALGLILQGGLPVLNRMKERAALSKMKELMLMLDKNIVELINEGEGSQRLVTIDMQDGIIRIEGDSLIWEFRTQSQLISPRSSTVIGNMLITSNANVQSSEAEDHYILKNTIGSDTFEARIKKIGTPDQWEPISTSELIEYISFNGQKLDGSFNFSINSDSQTSYGSGYTQLVPYGNSSNIGRAKIIAHINSTVFSYDLELIMESYADYLITQVRNLK